MGTNNLNSYYNMYYVNGKHTRQKRFWIKTSAAFFQKAKILICPTDNNNCNSAPFQMISPRNKFQRVYAEHIPKV